MAEYFRPKSNVTNGVLQTRQKDNKSEATRLLGDTLRQDQTQGWFYLDTKPRNSKREEDAVDVILPGLMPLKVFDALRLL